MPICSYLVVPDEGVVADVSERLAGMPGCQVTRAENRDVLILVTDTPGLEEEHELRVKVEAMQGIQALLLTFGEIDPDTDLADPVTVGGGGRRGLPLTASAGGSVTVPPIDGPVSRAG